MTEAEDSEVFSDVSSVDFQIPSDARRNEKSRFLGRKAVVDRNRLRAEKKEEDRRLAEERKRIEEDEAEARHNAWLAAQDSEDSGSGLGDSEEETGAELDGGDASTAPDSGEQRSPAGSGLKAVNFLKCSWQRTASPEAVAAAQESARSALDAVAKTAVDILTARSAQQ